jgi:hypothetical protein
VAQRVCTVRRFGWQQWRLVVTCQQRTKPRRPADVVFPTRNPNVKPRTGSYSLHPGNRRVLLATHRLKAMLRSFFDHRANSHSQLVHTVKGRINQTSRVRLEVLKAVTVGTAVCWVVAPCSTIKIRRHFGGASCALRQDERAPTAVRRKLAAPCRQSAGLLHQPPSAQERTPFFAERKQVAARREGGEDLPECGPWLQEPRDRNHPKYCSRI